MLKKLFKNFIKGKSVEKVVENKKSQNTVVLDFGNCEIKGRFKGRKTRMKSCIKRVTKSMTIMQENALSTGGEFFLVGDDTTPLNRLKSKIERPNARELIAYAINTLNKGDMKVDSKGRINIDLHMLLPYSQMKTEDEFKRLLNGDIDMVIDEKEYKYHINLNRCYPEGLMVLKSVNKKPKRNKRVVIDIGGGTTEVFVFDRYNNLTNKISIKLGTRNLASFYVLVVDSCSTSISMNEFLQNKYPFTRAELEAMQEVNDDFLELLMTDIVNTVLNFLNPYDTEIIFVGGGSKTLEISLKKWFKDSKFELTFLDSDTSVFANVDGIYKYLLDRKGCKSYESDNPRSEVKSEVKSGNKSEEKELLRTESVQEKSVDLDLDKSELKSETEIKEECSGAVKSEGEILKDIPMTPKWQERLKTRELLESGYKQQEIADTLSTTLNVIKNNVKELRKVGLY